MARSIDSPRVRHEPDSPAAGVILITEGAPLKPRSRRGARGSQQNLRPVGMPTRDRQLELLYFPDCPHWRVADERLREVANRFGLSIEYRLVTSSEEADRLSFRGSPTILIDGFDLFAVGDEPVGLSCRIYRTPDGYAGSPTTAQIAMALAADE